MCADKYANSALRLIYIMGDGRSGSTVLAVLLGNHPAIAAAGELAVWPKYEGYPKPGDDGPEHHRFWESIRQAYLEYGPAPDFPTLIEAQEEIDGYRHFFRVLFNRVSGVTCQIYCRHTDKLLGAIRSVSGRQVLVDSSKRMGRAWMLLRSRPSEVRIIHLVRDPRAMLWSQMKRNVEQDYKSPIKAMLHYSMKNLMSTFVQWRAPQGTVLRMRYEDIVQQPLVEIRRIGSFLGLSMEELSNKIETDPLLLVPHLIDGNRLRQEKSVALRLDDEWRHRLRTGYRWLAVLLTLPFFLIYRYWRADYAKK
jgi:hypothetical protein